MFVTNLCDANWSRRSNRSFSFLVSECPILHHVVSEWVSVESRLQTVGDEVCARDVVGLRRAIVQCGTDFPERPPTIRQVRTVPPEEQQQGGGPGHVLHVHRGGQPLHLVQYSIIQREREAEVLELD